MTVNSAHRSPIHPQQWETGVSPLIFRYKVSSEMDPYPSDSLLLIGTETCPQSYRDEIKHAQLMQRDRILLMSLEALSGSIFTAGHSKLLLQHALRSLKHSICLWLPWPGRIRSRYTETLLVSEIAQETIQRKKWWLYCFWQDTALPPCRRCQRGAESKTVCLVKTFTFCPVHGRVEAWGQGRVLLG